MKEIIASIRRGQEAIDKGEWTQNTNGDYFGSDNSCGCVTAWMSVDMKKPLADLEDPYHNFLENTLDEYLENKSLVSMSNLIYMNDGDNWSIKNQTEIWDLVPKRNKLHTVSLEFWQIADAIEYMYTDSTDINGPASWVPASDQNPFIGFEVEDVDEAS